MVLLQRGGSNHYLIHLPDNCKLKILGKKRVKNKELEYLEIFWNNKR